eukprot:scaffold132746_cov20-Prasinocladus_malaysianus.AAC.1
MAKGKEGRRQSSLEKVDSMPARRIQHKHRIRRSHNKLLVTQTDSNTCQKDCLTPAAGSTMATKD